MSFMFLFFNDQPNRSYILGHNHEAYLNSNRQYSTLKRENGRLALTGDIENDDVSLAVGKEGRFVVLIKEYITDKLDVHEAFLSRRTLIPDFIFNTKTAKEFLDDILDDTSASYQPFQLICSDGMSVFLLRWGTDPDSRYIAQVRAGFSVFSASHSKTENALELLRPWIINYLSNIDFVNEGEFVVRTLFNILWCHQDTKSGELSYKDILNDLFVVPMNTHGIPGYYGTVRTQLSINTGDGTHFYESYLSTMNELSSWKSQIIVLDHHFTITSRNETFFDRSTAPLVSGDDIIGAGPNEKKLGLRDLFVFRSPKALERKKRYSNPHCKAKFLSGYNIFAKETRHIVILSEATFQQKGHHINNLVNRKLGELWKELPLDQKEQYEIKAYQEKVRYIDTLERQGRGSECIIKKVKNFQKAVKCITGESNESIRTIAQKSIKQHRKRLLEPKRFRTNYVLFTSETRKKIRSQYPSLGFAEIGAILGEIWKNLNPKERAVGTIVSPLRQRYDDMAREDKERYEHEMQEYERSLYLDTGSSAASSQCFGAASTVPRFDKPLGESKSSPPMSAGLAEPLSVDPEPLAIPAASSVRVHPMNMPSGGLNPMSMPGLSSALASSVSEMRSRPTMDISEDIPFASDSRRKRSTQPISSFSSAMESKTLESQSLSFGHAASATSVPSHSMPRQVRVIDLPTTMILGQSILNSSLSIPTDPSSADGQQESKDPDDKPRDRSSWDI